MRLAAIDVGTNTVRLLVAEVAGPGGWRVVDDDQRVTRLGEGLARAGVLGADPIARTTRTVTAYVARALGWAVDDIRIVATSAVRDAANGRAFADGLARATGRRVQVITGEEEARLTLRGVLHSLGPVGGVLVSFDIGGGSTEYVLAREGRLERAVSLPLGVAPLAEAYPFPGTVEWSRYRRLEGEVARRLDAELPADIARPDIDVLVGTAGTVTTLAALDLGLTAYDPVRVRGHALTRGRVAALLERLGALTVAARARVPCLEPGRADLIIPGLAIVRATMDRLRADRLLVSDAGLREGVLLEAVPGG